MNVDQDVLDKLAVDCERAHAAALYAGEHLKDGDGAVAAEYLQQARETIWQIRDVLINAGAVYPEASAVPAEIPLRLLNTPANRRYLRALLDALDAARDVDRERNHAGGSRVEAVEALLLPVQAEVIGPPGQDESG